VAGEEEWGRCWTFAGRIIWAEQPGVWFFPSLLIGNSRIYIVSVFLGIPAFQADIYTLIYVGSNLSSDHFQLGRDKEGLFC
jgi:hypothetical protein